MSPIQENISLLPYNTFKIDVEAKYFTRLHTLDDALELFHSDIFKKEDKLFLGGGSNILFTKNFDGLVIKNEIKGIETVREDENTVTLKVGSGENWHAFVMHCVERNLGGIENLSLIPGTIGAAPMQNIGAYGVEVKEVIETVKGIETGSGKIKTFSNRECNFGYRESIFKHEAKDRYFISSITLTLTKKNHKFNTSYGAIQDTLAQMQVTEPSIKAISDVVIHIRRSKLPDPAEVGNAGSFFKNPSIHAELHDFLKRNFPSLPSYPAEKELIKIPAAWLIEQCGWKGKTFGHVGVHPRQALVLVNYGGGEGKKIWQLALDIQASVKEKFNIILQPEVNVM